MPAVNGWFVIIHCLAPDVSARDIIVVEILPCCAILKWEYNPTLTKCQQLVDICQKLLEKKSFIALNNFNIYNMFDIHQTYI